MLFAIDEAEELDRAEKICAQQGIAVVVELEGMHSMSMSMTPTVATIPMPAEEDMKDIAGSSVECFGETG